MQTLQLNYFPGMTEVYDALGNKTAYYYNIFNQITSIQYFLKDWSFRGNAEFSQKYGLKWRPDDFDPSSIGAYMPFAQLDADLTQVNQLLKHIKLGFGQCMDHACYDLRDGRITRDEAIELVRKYDGSGVELRDLKPVILKHALKRKVRIAVKKPVKLLKSIFSTDNDK